MSSGPLCALGFGPDHKEAKAYKVLETQMDLQNRIHNSDTRCDKSGIVKHKCDKAHMGSNEMQLTHMLSKNTRRGINSDQDEFDDEGSKE